MTVNTSSTDRVSCRMLVEGAVQGIGCRTTIVRLARDHSITGVVFNTNQGVQIELEGNSDEVAKFQAQLTTILPSSTLVHTSFHANSPLPRYDRFDVITHQAMGQLLTPIPSDLVTCENCRNEFNDPQDRRYRYPLNACSYCGPRFSIIHSMPFERHQSSLQDFPLCSNCLLEWSNPENRRFHAQTMACPKCGPRFGDLETAIEKLRHGQIVALLGVGGYQLLADATNSEAVAKLRERKGRPTKPFAILVENLDVARRFAILSDQEAELLTSPAGPIVIIDSKSQGLSNTESVHSLVRDNSTNKQNSLAKTLSQEVALGRNTIGIMLPTNPAQELLTKAVGPIVITSGNLEGAPIAFRPNKAEQSLKQIADFFVHHDRTIVRPIEDSVQQIVSGQKITMRMGRGLAPKSLPIKDLFQACHHDPSSQSKNDFTFHHSIGLLPASIHVKSCGVPIIAVGADHQVSIALFNGHQAVLGPHLGDMSSEESQERWKEHVLDLQSLYQFRPAAIAHDLDSSCFTSKWAIDFCKQRGLQSHAIQHHHAHIASGMIECGFLQRDVLGIAWDEGGLGTDGSIWGGEFLHASFDRADRVACIRPMECSTSQTELPESLQMASSLLAQLDHAMLTIPGTSPRLLHDAVRSVRVKFHSVLGTRMQEHRSSNFAPEQTTTSAGKMLDAFAAFVLATSQDGRELSNRPWAMELEELGDQDDRETYPFPLVDSTMLRDIPRFSQQQLPISILDWQPLLLAICHDLDEGISTSKIAMRLYRSVAEGIMEVCRKWSTYSVVLAGSVFESRRLTQLVMDLANKQQLDVSMAQTIPLNDGGIAAGQLAIAMRRIERTGIH